MADCSPLACSLQQAMALPSLPSQQDLPFLAFLPEQEWSLSLWSQHVPACFALESVAVAGCEPELC